MDKHLSMDETWRVNHHGKCFKTIRTKSLIMRKYVCAIIPMFVSQSMSCASSNSTTAISNAVKLSQYTPIHQKL